MVSRSTVVLATRPLLHHAHGRHGVMARSQSQSTSLPESADSGIASGGTALHRVRPPSVHEAQRRRPTTTVSKAVIAALQQMAFRCTVLSDISAEGITASRASPAAPASADRCAESEGPTPYRARSHLAKRPNADCPPHPRSKVLLAAPQPRKEAHRQSHSSSFPQAPIAAAQMVVPRCTGTAANSRFLGGP